MGIAPAQVVFSQEASPTASASTVAAQDNISAIAVPLATNADPRAYLPLIRVASNPDTPIDIGNVSIVFVQRKINNGGSVYYAAGKDMPGVGAHSRVRPANPGKLLVRKPNGSIVTLVDGANPTAASLDLIDVNGPEVSYDGDKIVFAGLPNGTYRDNGPAQNTNAWRIYVINVDGTGLKQLTQSDQNLNLGAAGLPGSLQGYDDFDPVWLPDGRIAFVSTRYPAFAHYSGVRATNLYVMKADGSEMKRITAERNGADRPLVDPLTGRIFFSRWWRNHRFAWNDMSTVNNPNGGYVYKDGLSAERSTQLSGGDYADMLWRNAWQPAAINPDGTNVAMWSGWMRDEEANHIYGGTFLPNGNLVANFFPMYNMTEAAGFGGLRLYTRGGNRYTPLMGITDLTGSYVSTNPNSYGVYKGQYYTEPEALSNTQLIVSMAKNTQQDYGLYVTNIDGSNRTLLYDNPGTAELRARVIRSRPQPPLLSDKITQTPSLLPPSANGPYDIDGTFVFNALNVYGNGPVDMEIVSAPPVGSASKIRFFIDHQRSAEGSYPNLDWPILLDEMPISPAGVVVNQTAPANVSLFEQIRDKNNQVPLTIGDGGTNLNGDGAAHVAGMNYGRTGEVSRCIGCHAGHSMIPVPANDADAQWSNLAPGATVAVSSSRDPNYNRGVNDRRVMKGEIWRYWTATSAQNQWVELRFPVPVIVRNVRLYNPRQGDEANSSLQVRSTNVKLFNNGNQVANKTSGALSVSGTDVTFADVTATVVRVEITGMSGTFYGSQVASIGEIEVIAKGAP